MEHYFTNNTELKSELRNIKYNYKTYSFNFYSDNGVFSKSKIDYGSKLLIETFLEKNQDKINHILDIGCGYGFMGIVLSKILNTKVTLVDVNKRAVHLTKMNIKENQVEANAIESNIYENIEGKYDLIITNPPIRAGKKVVLEILKNSKFYLTEQGSLWFVIRKDQGAKSIVKELLEVFDVKLIEKDKGFYIFHAKNVDIEK